MLATSVAVACLFGAPFAMTTVANSASTPPVVRAIASEGALPQAAAASGYWKYSCGWKPSYKLFGIQRYEFRCWRTWVSTDGGGGGW